MMTWWSSLGCCQALFRVAEAVHDRRDGEHLQFIPQVSVAGCLACSDCLTEAIPYQACSAAAVYVLLAKKDGLDVSVKVVRNRLKLA